MKKFRLLVVALFFTLAFFYSKDVASAGGYQDFVLMNASSVPIYYVHASGSEVGIWEEDILGDNRVLMPGESVNIRFSRLEERPYWDVRITFKGGYKSYKYGVDLRRAYMLAVDGSGNINVFNAY